MALGDKLTSMGAGAKGGGGEPAAGPGPLAAALPIEQYLAAIIAHELSNPFTALAGRVDLMRNRKDLSAPLVRDLEAMKTANERIDRILSNLKSFSRREAPPPRPVELMPLVQSGVETFRASPTGERLEVTVTPWDTPVRCIADPGLLQAVIAATLEALTGRSPGTRSVEVRLAMNAADEEVCLVFRDDGPEISDEHVARIFHPFSGPELATWPGVITLAYGYYIIRAWGGTYRFRAEGRDTITELCLALQL